MLTEQRELILAERATRPQIGVIILGSPSSCGAVVMLERQAERELRHRVCQATVVHSGTLHIARRQVCTVPRYVFAVITGAEPLRRALGRIVPKHQRRIITVLGRKICKALVALRYRRKSPYPGLERENLG